MLRSELYLLMTAAAAFPGPLVAGLLFFDSLNAFMWIVVIQSESGAAVVSSGRYCIPHFKFITAFAEIEPQTCTESDIYSGSNLLLYPDTASPNLARQAPAPAPVFL